MKRVKLSFNFFLNNSFSVSHQIARTHLVTPFSITWHTLYIHKKCLLAKVSECFREPVLIERKIPKKKSFHQTHCRSTNAEALSERNRANFKPFVSLFTHFVISIHALIRLVYPALIKGSQGEIVVPVVLVLSSRGRARRDRDRKKKREQTRERACSRYHVTPKSFSLRYDSLLYALDGPPSVSCSEMLVEESEIDTTSCAHALLPSRALMHCQGRIDPLCPTANIFRHRYTVIDNVLGMCTTCTLLSTNVSGFRLYWNVAFWNRLFERNRWMQLMVENLFKF